MTSNPEFGKATTAEEVATALKDNIIGKNVLVFGATVKSLGGEFLRVIAPYAKNIWVLGRNKERLQFAVDEALKPLGEKKPTIHIVIADASSVESVRQAAAEINAQGLPIDVLLLGVLTGGIEKLHYSTEGFEAQLAGNHLATFLLTSLLLPRLRQVGPGARVVTVASDAHAMGNIRWDDPNYLLRPEEYDPIGAYAQTKLANILFTKELAKRLKPEGLLAYALHPGSIETNGVLAIPKEVFINSGVFLPDGSWSPHLHVKTIPEGTATYVVAAFDPSIKDQSGVFLDDCQVHEDRLAPSVKDEDAVRLWKLTEDLVGFKFLS